MKIVQFFQDDGFDITIDDVLKFQPNKHYFELQSGESLHKNIKVDLYNMLSETTSRTSIQINVENNNQQLFAVKSSLDIPPLFKRGTVFIADVEKSIQEGTLAIVDTSLGMDVCKVLNKSHIECKVQFLRNKKITYVNIDAVLGTV